MSVCCVCYFCSWYVGRHQTDWNGYGLCYHPEYQDDEEGPMPVDWMDGGMCEFWEDEDDKLENTNAHVEGQPDVHRP